MLIARNAAELRQARSRLDGRIALVPTMGALHAGHLALLAVARQAAEIVAASIFVNPTQFEDASDLARYPRDAAADLNMMRSAGCDLVWMPAVETMYPAGDATAVLVEGPALGWEGAARPGHFRGVATVVAKLFGQVRPHFAVFGEKDWQQLQVIRRMTADLALPVEIIGAATMREADGLAMSSRNRFLAAADRERAPLLFATLTASSVLLRSGRTTHEVLPGAMKKLERAGFRVEYLACVEGETMLPAAAHGAGARLIAAAGLGSVRLIDNVAA